MWSDKQPSVTPAPPTAPTTVDLVPLRERLKVAATPDEARSIVAAERLVDHVIKPEGRPFMRVVAELVEVELPETTAMREVVRSFALTSGLETRQSWDDGRVLAWYLDELQPNGEPVYLENIPPLRILVVWVGVLSFELVQERDGDGRELSEAEAVARTRRNVMKLLARAVGGVGGKGKRIPGWRVGGTVVGGGFKKRK